MDSQPGDRGAFLAAGRAELEIMEMDLAAAGVQPGAPAGWHLALQVEDLDAEYGRLQALRVPILREIREHPWGTRDFSVRDPAGNAVLVFEAPGT
jgi:catechol 2,3-dioxygenase-like lactoylglutathione lyase family enzyme